MYPEKFGVTKETDIVGTFANNDLNYIDSTGIDHEQFSFGLKKSLFNFMHGICLDYDLQEWFDFKIPKTTIRPDFIFDALEEETNFSSKPNAKVLWLGGKPTVRSFTKTKKGNSWEVMELTFHDKKEKVVIQVNQKEGEWLVKTLDIISVSNSKTTQFQELKADFESEMEDFELFWYSKSMKMLQDFGLLVL